MKINNIIYNILAYLDIYNVDLKIIFNYSKI